jgi:hypothetical protein
MNMITPEQRMERLILALCDELYWGLRSFYAAKILYKSELRITPTLFDTFYWSCLDQSALILSRMIVAKAKYKDDSVNIQYLLEQARNNPQLFQYSKPGDIEKTVRTHSELLESYKSFIDVLEDQRDRNLTHLDLKHVKQPEWRESQTQLDLDKVEQLYQDLTGLMIVYHSKFFGHEFNFNDWQTISQQEVDYLISYYRAYQSKT